MARITLDVEAPLNRMTLKALIEAEGHQIAAEDGEVILTDDPERGIRQAAEVPVLLLTTAGAAAAAVEAMRQGVYGYILLPFLPGEAALMITRALESRRGETKPGFPRNRNPRGGRAAAHPGGTPGLQIQPD